MFGNGVYHFAARDNDSFACLLLHGIEVSHWSLFVEEALYVKDVLALSTDM